jgi:hypothetical protein
MSAVITNKDYKPLILALRIGMKTLKVLVEKMRTTQHMVISSFNIQPAFTLFRNFQALHCYTESTIQICISSLF